MAEEQLEERELLRREADFDVAAVHATARRVQHEVAGRKDRRTLTGTSPDQGPDPRQRAREKANGLTR